MRSKPLLFIALVLFIWTHIPFCMAGTDDAELSIEEQQVVVDMTVIAVVLICLAEHSGALPDSSENLWALGSVEELHDPPYEDRIQSRDPWGNKYLYLAGDRDFTVFSPGRDGRLDLDYLEVPKLDWADMAGDDVIASSEGWVKRPLSHRGRQEQTMSNLRSLGTAIEEFSIDNNAYPVAANVADLETHLVPAYIRTLPRHDGWGNELFVFSDLGDYVLRSPGRYGVPDAGVPVGATSSYESDIVFSNGSFEQWPEGPQH